MKIGIIGTHGVGKTTIKNQLTAALCERGLHVIDIDEVVRLLPVKPNEETTIEDQHQILEAQVRFEKEAETQNPDVIITDRTVLDNYAYLFRANANKHYQTSLALVKDHLPTYDLLIHRTINPTIPLKADGFRATDKVFREEIDAIIGHLLQEHSDLIEQHDISSIQSDALQLDDQLLTEVMRHAS